MNHPEPKTDDEPNPELDARIEQLRQKVLESNRRHGRHGFERPVGDSRKPYNDD